MFIFSLTVCFFCLCGLCLLSLLFTSITDVRSCWHVESHSTSRSDSSSVQSFTNTVLDGPRKATCPLQLIDVILAIGRQPSNTPGSLDAFSRQEQVVQALFFSSNPHSLLKPRHKLGVVATCQKSVVHNLCKLHNWLVEGFARHDVVCRVLASVGHYMESCL